MTTLPTVLVVSARGSTEPQSGSHLLTPLARNVMRQYPGDSRLVELRYPASFVTFTATYPAHVDLGDSPHHGVANLIELLNGEARHKPDQYFVLLGWSQGAQVIGDTLLAPPQREAGRAAGDLDPHVLERIAAITLFGNPTFTAGEPYNAGHFQDGISGVTPRPAGALSRHREHLRDYCAQDDLAAQLTPTASVDGHISYFHNDMTTQAAQFIASRLDLLADLPLETPA